VILCEDVQKYEDVQMIAVIMIFLRRGQIINIVQLDAVTKNVKHKITSI